MDDLRPGDSPNELSSQAREIGAIRGLRLAEHGLFVTVCRHRLPAPDQENESPIGFRRPGISVWQPGVDGRQGQRAGPSDVADSGRCGRRGGIPARAVPGGRPGGRAVPGRVCGHRRDGRPLRSVTSMGRCPARGVARAVARHGGSSQHSQCYQWNNPWDQCS
jgi:hypothetical protein